MSVLSTMVRERQHWAEHSAHLAGRHRRVSRFMHTALWLAVVAYVLMYPDRLANLFKAFFALVGE